MNRIGVLGGTFDPIHKGHIALALAAGEECSLNRIIFMPALIQPLKRDKNITGDEERLDMLNLGLEDEAPIFSAKDIKVEISTLEIDKGGVSFTYNTIRSLKNVYPNDKLYFIMGSDPLKNTDGYSRIEKWYKGEKLLKECDFIVSVRVEDERKNILETAERIHNTYGCEVRLLDSKMPDINSTMIRMKVKSEETISEFVSPSVNDYIIAKGLYKN